MSATSRNLPPLAPVDPNRRYDVETALAYLNIGRKIFYEEVAAGRIKTIAVGRTQRRTSKLGREYERTGRRLVPGSEIIRLSAVPA
jgi:hypothetical protein